MMKFFQARKSTYRTNARLIDDVIYTSYAYEDEPSTSMTSSGRDSWKVRAQDTQTHPRPPATVGDLLGVSELRPIESGLSDTEIGDSREQGRIRKTEFEGGSLPSAGEETMTDTTGNMGEKKRRKRVHFDSGKGTEADVFVFEYGTVVIWGMNEAQERRFLSSM